jgi:hypothetical protein
MVLRVSRLGLTVVIVFLLAAATLFAAHLHAFETHNSTAEGALLFFLFTLPWALMLPEWVIGQAWWDGASYYVSWLFVCANAFLLYCLAGGIGFTAADRDARRGRTRDLHVVQDG